MNRRSSVVETVFLISSTLKRFVDRDKIVVARFTISAHNRLFRVNFRFGSIVLKNSAKLTFGQKT